MILSAFTSTDPAYMFTIDVNPENGMYVRVGMTEEELFRAILGDEEYEHRRTTENPAEWGQAKPKVIVKESEIPVSGEVPRVRFFDLRRDRE